MCGIFGYIGRKYPERDIMQEIAFLAGTRGCHSNGVAWLTPDGSIQVKKQLGKIVPETIFTGVTSKAIIGQCRLATSGPPTLANAQPLITSTMAVAHNGTIRAYPQLALQFKDRLRTQCDSELLLFIPPQELFGRLDTSPYAVLFIKDRQLTAMRRDLPLYRLETADDGVYYCSRQFRNAKLIENNKIITSTLWQ